MPTNVFSMKPLKFELAGEQKAKQKTSLQMVFLGLSPPKWHPLGSASQTAHSDLRPKVTSAMVELDFLAPQPDERGAPMVGSQSLFLFWGRLQNYFSTGQKRNGTESEYLMYFVLWMLTK